MCAYCRSRFSLEHNKLKCSLLTAAACLRSEDGVVNVPLLLGMVLGRGIVGAVVISGAVNTLSDFGVITDLRLMIGL